MVEIAKANNAAVLRSPAPDALTVGKADLAVAMRLPDTVAIAKANGFALMRLPDQPVVCKANMCVVMRLPVAANRRMSLM